LRLVTRDALISLYCGENRGNCGEMAFTWSELTDGRRGVGDVEDRESSVVYLHEYVRLRSRIGQPLGGSVSEDVAMSDAERDVQARYVRLAIRLSKE
jgi:hypothetical protein